MQNEKNIEILFSILCTKISGDWKNKSLKGKKKEFTSFPSENRWWHRPFFESRSDAGVADLWSFLKPPPNFSWTCKKWHLGPEKLYFYLPLIMRHNAIQTAEETFTFYKMNKDFWTIKWLKRKKKKADQEEGNHHHHWFKIGLYLPFYFPDDYQSIDRK